MTVNTISSIAEFDTNGVTTNFPFYFKFLANEDLVVTYVDPLGVSSTLNLGTHYTVNGAGNDQGGSVVTTSALAGPGQLVVSREMEAFQQTSLRNQGKFLAETHEDVFDKLTMLIQQGLATFTRALKRPLGRDYFFAEDRRIVSVKDPVDLQDAATKNWAQQYIASILAAGQGPINNAANVIYASPYGDIRTVQDLSNIANPYLGSALIGRQPLQINDVAELRVTPGRFAGDRCYLHNYLAGDGKGARGGTWATGASADNGGTHFAATGGTWVMDLTPKGRIDVAFWGLPLESGYNDVQFAAIEAYMYANRVSCEVGPGIHDNGPIKYPFRTGDVAAAAYRDYGGVGLYCTTETVFRTTSAEGNDVFNLVCVEGFNIWGFPTLEATITTELVSGSNGVSFVHGGKNCTIEINGQDLPFIDRGAGIVDGGSTSSLQASASSMLPFENITIRGSGTNVSHGFSCSGPYQYFVDYPVKSVVLDDLRVERAYRSVSINVGAPSSAPATPPHIGITGRVLTKNCQQVLIDGRGDGVKLEITVMNDMVKESLNVLPSDPLVSVVRLLGSKNFDYNVHGEIRSADTWLQIGGASSGGGVIGSTSRGILYQNVKFNSVNTVIDLVNSGGVDIAGNELHLNGITTGYSGVSARSTTLFVNGNKVNNTIYPGDAAVTLQPNSHTCVIFKVALTATRLVTLPASGNIGDIVDVVRMSTATGASSVQVLGANYLVSTNARFVYNGSAWERTDTGTV